jgi:class 3 adenylate cyclase/tetratricopeptide (TPR) repeat protein
MKCPRCSAPTTDEARYCEDCGARLERPCPACGQPVTTGKKFCRACGAELVSTTSPLPTAASYTPRHLAERILGSRTALEGERKQVTVLFADMKGSMELLAERDPEEARRLLDPVLGLMMEAVHRYEGTVNQVMGDGIMALFGAPIAHEDHAARACWAALRMQEAVRRHAESLRSQEGVLVQVRIGLNSGEVVVRSIGSDLQMDYTAVGQTTHLAARLEQLAAPGTVLLSPLTLRLVEGYVEAQALGPVNVKGLPAPVEVHELRGPGWARTRLQVAAARGLTRFVGRQSEMDQLGRAFTLAARGQGQVVAVVGEPGVGKSRLFHEFTHALRAGTWLVLQAGSLSHGRATPYLPVVELLRAYFRVETDDSGRTIREKVAGKVLTLDRALEPTIPPLLTLLDVTVDDVGWQALDSIRRRQRTREAVRQLLLRESQVQPLLLVLEDLHWIDSETQALLDGLVESLAGARVLLLVNYRPEYQHGWGRKTYYSQLRIDPLARENAEELLGWLLGDADGLPALARRLIEITEGNPFFLEEMVRTLVETRGLIGERGSYRLAPSVGVLDVPATVQALLAGRIDRLAPGDKRLLQSAAVVGKDVPLSLLLAVAEEPEASVRAALVRLGESEFLYETSLFPEPEYTFKHALTHDVAYGSLLNERRRELHARVLGALERLHAARLDQQIDRLAHHSRRAERWDRALPYLRRAGLKASERLALREAAAYLEDALSVVERLPRQRETTEQSIDLRIDIRGPLFNLTEYERLRRHLDEGARLARDLGDDHRLARIVTAQTHYDCIIAGQMASAAEHANEALGIAMRLDDPGLIVVARQALGQVLHSQGRHLDAVHTLEANVSYLLQHAPRAAGMLGFQYATATRVWLVFSLIELGRLGEAIVVADEVVRQAAAGHDLYGQYHALWAQGATHLERGDWESAIGSFRQAERIAVQAELQGMIDNARGLLGRAQALGGRTAESIALLEPGVLGRERRNAFSGQRDLYYLGDAYRRAGRLDDALAMATRALDTARHSSQQGREAYALKLLADVHAELGKVDGDLHAAALARASELGMLPLVAHCHAGLATLHRRTGRPAETNWHLAEARALYEDMGMAYWLRRLDEAGSSRPG